ncbi:MAG: flagellar hook-associated protein FlgK [Gemmatimonadaceae bacterium]
MSSLISVANSALLTQQAALQTISQNIANGQTPGYSRQEAVIASTTSLQTGNGFVGTGVSVQTISRVRDQLLDDAYRTTAGQTGEADARNSLLGQLQAIFGEPSDQGMANALDQFWGSWSDLATSPQSGANKVIVQQRGRSLAQLLNSYDDRLTQVRNTALQQVQGAINEINQQTATIAELNGQISAAETTGATANDLRDHRDRMIDTLAKNGGIRVIPQSSGSVTVMIGASTIVEGSTARALSGNTGMSTGSVDVPVEMSLSGSLMKSGTIGGRLGALLDTVNNSVPDLRAQLNAMAMALVTKVNGVHTQGYLFPGGTIPGTAAGNFFDPGTVSTPVTAGSIRLDTAVEASAAKIAASKDANAQSDNQLAVQMKALIEDQNAISFTNRKGGILSGSFLGFHRDLMTTLGYSVKAAEDDSTAATAAQSQADSRRQSVIGVNTDEELVRMMRFQQSYTAAAKLLKSVDELTQTLLGLI